MGKHVLRKNVAPKLDRDPNQPKTKLPMRVQYVGEEAEDAGGVSKEFFLLLMPDLLDP